MGVCLHRLVLALTAILSISQARKIDLGEYSLFRFKFIFHFAALKIAYGPYIS